MVGHMQQVLNFCDVRSKKLVNETAKYGSLAQLGEHLPYKQGVIGSSPIVST